MNILMVHPHDIHHDPWTIRILALARELQNRGHAVKLCHLPRRDKPKHAPLRMLKPGDPPLFFMKPRQKNVVYNYQLIQRLAADCDVIHVQKCFAAASLPVLWTARLLGKKLHYDWDDDETAISKIVEKRKFSRLQLAVYERMLPHFADSLTYSSRAIQERALRLGFPEDRMRHLPVGADVKRFSPDHRSKEILLEWGLDPEKLVVFYMGQLEGAASAHLLIQAAPEILRVHPQTQFLIAGGGEQEDALRSEAENSPACGAIYMTGYVDSLRIPHIVGAADVCVACFEDNAGTRAKSPLKIAEYLAAGKPIVASRVGEAPWMIDGCGVAVNPGSPGALAQGVLLYAADDERRRVDGEKARQRALQHFTWEKGAEKLLEAYSCALQPCNSS
ncbi:MAG: glycosyltransferase family 4 protein [Candidatus Hinthialibacter sp.]